MNQLQLCKLFAELEGVDALEHKGHLVYPSDQGYVFERGVTCDWYNPITNLALNCSARDKYKVEIEYRDLIVTIWLDDEATTAQSIKADSRDDIPKAVIVAILKAEGKL